MSAGRLLSINNFHYRRAGSDAAFLDHDRLFTRQGWQTAVFSMAHRDNLESPWSADFVDEIELARDYPPLTRLRLATKVIYSIEARDRLMRLLDRFRPDVVHLHSVYHHLSPSVLSALRGAGVPVVLTAHDYKLACPAYKMFDGNAVCEDCRGGRILPLVRKRCIHGSLAMSSLVAVEAVVHRALGSYARSVARIVCPSRFLLGKLAEWGWPEAQLAWVPNFFDPWLWQPRFEPGDHFLYFGRLAPEKGLATLIRAASTSGSRVRIVGWGRERDSLERLAAAGPARVEFVDRVGADALAAMIRDCRAVVLPAVWYENASLAALEAFACGKPVITSRIGGNPEIVTPGVNGWLVPPGDEVALAETLREVDAMPDAVLEALGRRAHGWVHQHRGPQRYYDAMLSLYRSLGARVAPGLAAVPGG